MSSPDTVETAELDRPARAGSRRGWAAVSALVLVVVLGLLWWVSVSSVSPEQRVADAAPPPTPVVEAALEERALQEVAVVRGRVVAAADQPIAAPAAAEERAAVVTDLRVQVGDEVAAGDVVAAVADRPVIVVPIDVPLYRTLLPGDQGPDVRRLQQALGALGDDVEVDGRFGRQTQEAVVRLYERHGFEPAETGPETEEALNAAQQQHQEATIALEDAELELQRARDGAAQARRDAARAAEQPSNDAADGTSGNDEPDAPADDASDGERDEGAELTVVPTAAVAAPDDADTGDGDASIAGADDAVVQARRNVDRARQAMADAAAARDEAAAAVGIQVPSGELVGIASLPAVVTAVEVAEGEVAAEGPLLTVTTGDLVLHANVTASLAALLVPGTVASSEDGWELEVTVQESSEDGDPVVVLRPQEALSAEELGRDVRIEAQLGGSSEPVLAAPVTALRTDADGDHLRVLDGDEVRRVGVTTGTSLGGWVELTDSEEPLTAGTRVQVG